MELIFATNNAHKIDEARQILGDFINLRSLAELDCHDDIPETACTLQGNALQKAEYVARKFGADCLADDTGLEVDALQGEPGVLSARYAGGTGHNSEANRRKLLQNMRGMTNRQAHFRTVVALIWQGKTHFFEGRVDGHIAENESGEGGFGYDSLFIPDGYTETFAQLPPEIKNSMSHRGRAMRQMADFLNKQTQQTHTK